MFQKYKFFKHKQRIKKKQYQLAPLEGDPPYSLVFDFEV